MTTSETTPAQLDREQLPEQFIPGYVEPGTVYQDEPGATAPPGWYVLAEHETGSGEGADIAIKIELATDPNGVDIAGALARKIADLLDEFAQDEPAPGEEWVDNLQRVEARTATGNRLYGTGVVVAYTDRPTVTIRRDDGTRFHWIADLCRPARAEGAES